MSSDTAMTSDRLVFVAGISGLLGLNFALAVRGRMRVAGAYSTHPVDIAGLDARRFDLTDSPALEEWLRGLGPSLVVNAAGLTNVEACETDPALARRLNVELAARLAGVAHRIGARMIHVSTDHLSDGLQPLRREEDPVHPLNVYAQTKRDAERAVLDACPSALVVRTNFYGWGPAYRPSFSDWILQALREGRPLTMFDDVYVTPILVNDLADVLLEAVAADLSGLYNIAGGERLSKYDFACRLAAEFREDASRIRAIPVGGFPFRARRPSDMSLSCARIEQALGRRMPRAAEGLVRLRQLETAGWPTASRQAARGRT